MEEELQLQYEAPVKKRRLWLALLLNIYVYTGYLYLGEWKRWLKVFLTLTAILALEMISYKFLTFKIWFPMILLVSFASLIFIIIDTVKLTRKINKAGYILKAYNKWYVYIGIIIIMRTFYNTTGIGDIEDFFVIAETPTGSMENSVLPDEYLVYDKTVYGLKNFSVYKFLFPDNHPQRGDVVVFNFPGQRDETEPEKHVTYFKRIIGLPGETIEIKNRRVYINNNYLQEKFEKKFSLSTGIMDIRPNPYIFPKNSNWNEDYYGPLKIPKSGDTLKIDSSSIEQWEVFIKRDAGREKSYPVQFMKDVISSRYYVVKKNYYFVLGDHRDNSFDSRYWGFVAEDDITGKAYMVFFSYNKLYNNIRWERIGKEIE